MTASRRSKDNPHPIRRLKTWKLTTDFFTYVGENKTNVNIKAGGIGEWSGPVCRYGDLRTIPPHHIRCIKTWKLVCGRGINMEVRRYQRMKISRVDSHREEFIISGVIDLLLLV
jgi:hypothetical protein